MVALLLTLAGLLAHAWRYQFLTDDAFISFRYARNLSQGFGLVFNPGLERVEGYSNFLWVLALSAVAWLGIAPEQASDPLTLLATVVLWGLIVWAAWPHARAARRPWLVLIPAAGLAITRSVAVWSTSGLETRWFEALALGAGLRMVHEVRGRDAGFEPRAMSGWLWGLAAWTRPDGILLGACALIALGWYEARTGRPALQSVLRHAAPFILLVAAHFAFRRVYYHEWLPNTYYAKVGGRMWFDSGLRYLAAFVLEYGLPLTVPLVIAGVLQRIRERSSFFPLLVGALVIPHALYITAIGGDHFEYRPLDLYFPFLFLLVFDGARAWSQSLRGRMALGLLLPLIAIGLWHLPDVSHQEFPTRYAPGFPGFQLERSTDARAFLDPERDPLVRWPILRSIAAAHRDLLRDLTKYLVGIRQEEHRLFLATVIPEGMRLRGLIEAGRLPPDLYVAVDCVGAIPYYSGARTLDRLGLTDAHVAHSRFGTLRVMAHDKRATMDYARRRGVDLWATDPVHLLWRVTDTGLMRIMRGARRGETEAFVADAGDGYFLAAELPQGLAVTQPRIAGLELFPIHDVRAGSMYLEAAVKAFEDSVSRDPQDPDHLQRLAFLYFAGGRFAAAAELYRRIITSSPESEPSWESLGLCYARLGRVDEATAALQRALQIAEARGDESTSLEVRRVLAGLANPGALEPPKP